MRVTTTVLAFAAILAIAAAAPAGSILSPVSVINNTFGNATPDADMINGSGLPAFVSGVTDFGTYLGGNPIHSLVFTNEWFAPANGQVTGMVDYDLGMGYYIKQMAFWNEDAGGISRVTVYTSNDAAFGVSTNVGSFSPTDHPYNTNYPADVFDVTDSYGRYVRLMMAATLPQPPGWNGASIGEVAFDVCIPEPGTVALFALGLLGAAGLVRRRRFRA